MKKIDLIPFSDDSELARAAAESWVMEIEAANREGKLHCVALSGGRIARRFFAEAAELARKKGVAFDTVHFFWADERCVLPTDAESNFALANANLLQPLAIPAENVHRIAGERIPAQGAESASAELERVVTGNPAGEPVLDLVILGMGEDGHVASLFPGEPESMVSDPRLFRPVTASKPPPQRITLGYRPILAARQVWVLASGSGKAEALRTSLSPEGQTPLARILGRRAETRIFSDIGQV